MRISRQSMFVQWCWLTTEGGPPCRTSICVLFWRGFVLSPLLVIGLVGFSGFMVYQLVMVPVALWFLGGAVAAIFFSIGAIVLKRRRWSVLPAEHRQRSVVLTVLVERARAVKQRVCPVVELY